MAFPLHSAFLIVDVQLDFCPGGALAVRDGDQVLTPINRVTAEAVRRGAPILASRDWHPAASPHFAVNGGAWPVHCVQHSEGARFHPGLALPADTAIISKGDSQGDPEGYDAFDGHLDDGTHVADALRARGTTRVIVAGLATDYCVKNSVLGARRAGFQVTVLSDAIRAVDLAPGDAQRAIADMIAAGATFTASDELLREG
jgi:nicotinamidase/pyrazinamidase